MARSGQIVRDRGRIEPLMRSYYENYYRDQLGLPDWRERLNSRLDEERKLGAPNIDRVEKWIGYSFSGKRVLIVGAGTGAETFAFHQRGARAFAIEPDPKAFDILKLKARRYRFPAQRLRRAVAERIPFPANSFDFIYCYTVLEHVQNVEKSIDEMIRVCRVGGLVYIQTPDYRFPYEGHYKSARPGFSSKWLTYLLFWLWRKPVRFLRSVNFVNGPILDKIFMKKNVLTMRVSPPWLRDWAKASGAEDFVRFADRHGIGKDQFIFLRKLPS